MFRNWRIWPWSSRTCLESPGYCEVKMLSASATVAEALNILTSQYPGLSRHVRDDQGQIRQFLNIYLNDEDIRFLGGEDCAVKEGDKVLLVPSIAGGCQ